MSSTLAWRCGLGLLSGMAVLAACSHQPVHLRLSPDPGASYPRVDDRIPLRAGLYVEEGLRNQKLPFKPINLHASGWRAGDVFIGDRVVRDSEEMLGTIFQQVVLVDATGDPSPASGKGYDVLVSPHVVKWLHDYTRGDMTAEVTVRWSVVSRDGKEIYSTNLRGAATRTYTYGESWSTEFIFALIQQVTGQALADAFQKSAADLHSNAWWKTRWWAAGEE